MGKVWFTLGLKALRYHTARIAAEGTVKTVQCAATSLFYLPEVLWIPIPPLTRDGVITLSGKPAFAALPETVRQ